ncbi:MAG: effector-associated constant component EACC1 [Candidatus Sericytochromatia bacterium]
MAEREPESSIHVALQLEGDPDMDSEDREQLTRRLRQELLELDVDSVRMARGEGEAAGAKVADPVTLGAVVVALSAGGGVLPSLISTVQDWLYRSSKAHKISITIGDDKIELDKATAAQQQALVEAYVGRHNLAGASGG